MKKQAIRVRGRFSDRLPKNYSGTGITTRPIQSVLPAVLESIGSNFSTRPDLIMQSWKEIIGERLAPMTEAVSFQKGILHIKVKNSTLHSLLSGPEKGCVLEKLRKLFPSIEIKNILFKMG